MKLKRLNIRNFRSHESSTLEFGEFNVLAGPQGAGKTSVLDSICAALTGRTRLTDRRGAGIKDHIRRGEARLEVELTCQFGTDQPDSVVKRTVTESGQTLEVPFGGKNLSARQALLTERMGGVDEIPDVLLDPRLFADRSPDEQKQALLKLLRPPTIEVPKAAQAVGIQQLASVQQVDDQIKSIKEGSVRSLNAVIKNLEESCPAEPTPEELSASHRAQADLKTLETRIQSLALDISHADHLLADARQQAVEYAEATVLAEQLPSLRSQREEIVADESKLRDFIARSKSLQDGITFAEASAQKIADAQAAAARLPAWRTELEGAKAELQLTVDRYKQLQSEASDQRDKAEALKANFQSLSGAIELLSGVEGSCPTCSRKLTAKAKAELLESLSKQKESAKDAWTEQSKRSGEAHASLTAESAKGVEQRKRVDELSAAITRDEYAAKDADLKTRDPATLRTELDGVVRSITALMEKYQGADSANALASELRRLADVMAGKIADAERAEKLVSRPQPQADAMENKLLQLTTQKDACDRALPLVRATADSGREVIRRDEDYSRITAELTGHRTKREAYLEAVESLIALKDSIMGGDAAKKLQFDCTDIFQLFFPQTRVLLDPSGASVAPIGSTEGTPVAHLSSGQKVIFDMGLRIAAARATGFGVLAIDDANKLAPSAREAMLRCLQASGCQVIMCTTADRIGGIPGAVVYSLTNPGVWGPTKVVRV